MLSASKVYTGMVFHSWSLSSDQPNSMSELHGCRKLPRALARGTLTGAKYGLRLAATRVEEVVFEGQEPAHSVAALGIAVVDSITDANCSLVAVCNKEGADQCVGGLWWCRCGDA